MATVNFSVPDEVKKTFDAEFADENKSAIIAGLMRRAIEERRLARRREKLFEQLTRRRSQRGATTSDTIHTARRIGRP